MKRIGWMLFVWGLGSMAMGQIGEVRILTTDIGVSKGGQLSVGLFDSKESFPKTGQGRYTQLKKIGKSQMVVEFDEVTEGTYALAAFQDLDKDEKLKTNFMGFPQEPLGFSNNVKIRFGPHSFAQEKYEIEKLGVNHKKIQTEIVIDAPKDSV